MAKILLKQITMTDKEIQENNKLLAKFLGDELPWDYHTSWAWLMPIVDKIETLDASYYTVNIQQNKTTITCSSTTTNDPMYFATSSTTDSKLESTYRCVVEFIRWYNMDK